VAGYVDLPGVRTWYDELGSGDPLVLLHGGLADARFFEHNVGPLAERFHVFAPDQRGHGHIGDVEVSPDGEEQLRVVVEKVAELERTEPALPERALHNVKARTLVMFGDDDVMTMEHVDATYAGIPGSELAIVPGTSHFLLQEKPALCNDIIVQFLTEDPIPTVFATRRAS
jgi:pimeloyl-ACP methyl ester carboxylesterase